MSELDRPSVGWVNEACENFIYAYKRYQLHPEHPMNKAYALAALGALEESVKDHVSRETERIVEAIDDGPQPPF